MTSPCHQGTGDFLRCEKLVHDLRPDFSKLNNLNKHVCVLFGVVDLFVKHVGGWL